MAFKAAKEKLETGKMALIYPKGNSMTPLIKSGDAVVLSPVIDGKYKLPADKKEKDLKVGDIVLVRVKGSEYVHKIIAIDGNRVQIGNNHGHINGWTTKNKIYGVRF
jgi:hypothetical protein